MNRDERSAKRLSSFQIMKPARREVDGLKEAKIFSFKVRTLDWLYEKGPGFQDKKLLSAPWSPAVRTRAQDFLDGRKFVFTRSINSSLVALPSGFRFRCNGSQYVLDLFPTKLCSPHLATSLALTLSKSLDLCDTHLANLPQSVFINAPPLGSLSAGNISPPHIFHSEAIVTRPAKPRRH